MIKANSLLYAVYICLLVSILCGALIYFAQLYNQLNVYYSTRESLYIENQSAVNFALENVDNESVDSLNINSGFTSKFQFEKFGMLSILKVATYSKTDTVFSSHFIGKYTEDKTALYLANFDRGLTYSGKVSLIGNLKIPSNFINERYLKNEQNVLTKEGKTELSERVLPKLNTEIEKIFNQNASKLNVLASVEKSNDSIFYNQFSNPVIEIQLESPYMRNIVMKGNFIVHAKDSIIVEESAILKDIILKAPKVTVKDGFKGSIQVFATERIEIDSNVKLNYPSVLCLNNQTEKKAEIVIKNDTRIEGGIVLFGNSFQFIDENRVILKEKTLLVGDIYSTGKVNMQGKVFGSVYCNAIFNGLSNSSADNCLHNTEINVQKRPNYFVSIPMFDDNKNTYGIIKKLF